MLALHVARPCSARKDVRVSKTGGIMLANAKAYKLIKLARPERATAKSITSVDNELIGERGGRNRRRVLDVGCRKRFAL